MSDDRDWTPERVVELNRTIEQLWPTAHLAQREALASSLIAAVPRRGFTPSELYSALISTAERRDKGEYLPNYGTVMEFVMSRRRASRRQKRLEPGEGPPWTPTLWLSAFIAAGGPERRAMLDGDVARVIEPWLALIDELGLRCEHNIESDPAYDPQLVAHANERAAVVWDLHGGVGAAVALRTLGVGGRRRR